VLQSPLKVLGLCAGPSLQVVKISAVFIVMTIKTQILPVAAVPRIVIMVVVLVVNCQ
jgi:hypothetical protein